MIILFIIFILLPSLSIAEDIVVGNTYPLHEKNAIRELEERAKAVNWGEVSEPVRRKLKDYKPADYFPLPHTLKNKKYSVSLMHTVDFDVKDANGEVMYPKGFQFNPLDYVSLPYKMIFIDANEKSHIKWAKKYIKETDFIQLYVVNGSVFDLIKELDRKVYFAGHKITNKFNIGYVPSVVYQEGTEMIVENIFLGNKENESNQH